MTYSPTTKRTSPATVIPRPNRSYPYSAHPFSPGPDRVQVEETNVPAIRLAAPTIADTMGIQNFKSTWRRACFLSRFARCGLLAKIAPRGGVTRHDWNVSVRLASGR